MAATHAYVWIDHREAKIFGIGRNDTDEIVLHDHSAPRHIHRSEDDVHRGKALPDHAFFDEIAKALTGFKGIVIVGPGSTRTDLAGHLKARHPELAKRIWGIEPSDHPTEPQIIAAARKYFLAEARMHE